MRTKRSLFLLGSAAALFALTGGPAVADQGEDVLSGFDGDAPLVNNVTVAPVQFCGGGAALGLLDVGSQKAGNCTNAPTGDHFQQLITNSTLGR